MRCVKRSYPIRPARCAPKDRSYSYLMEKKANERKTAPRAKAGETEKKAREILSKPPRDKREVTIGPTDKTGPDITLG